MRRHVLARGEDQGVASITFSPPREGHWPDSIWLRPYFDPVSQSLKLQTQDGGDYPFERPLPVLAHAPMLSPLLHLARREGLLKLVPRKRDQ